MSAQDHNTEGHKFLEHTTDAYVEAWGPTLERAFVQAAKGLYETMVNLRTIDSIIEQRVRVAGHDKKELLYNWLEQLLLEFDTKQMVYGLYDLSIRSDTPTLFLLGGTLKGEKYDRQKHGSKTEIKAVTYHLMEIQENTREVRVRFILDL